MNRPLYYQNYHKHTSFSHRYNKDSPLTYNDYFKEYKKLADKGIPQIYSTVEHGWQSPYFRVYDDLEKFNKKNKEKNENYKPIKFIFGTEAYWVKNRFEKDSSNCHICLLAKNDNGRRKLNRAIYQSFQKDGSYYYKNRMDIDLLLSLPKDDIFVTSACIAFWSSYIKDNFDYFEIDEIVLKLFNHFTDFYLEVQANQTDMQKEINKHILELHYKYNIPIIAGTDSHVIIESQMEDREDLLRSNGIHYKEEDGWYMDLPSVKTFIKRFQIQGILNDNEIYEAIENTNKILDFEDIILDRSLKVPVAKQYKNLSLQERNEIFKNILRKEWKEQEYDINKDKYDKYISEIKSDIKEVESCNMADYFIDTYLIMKKGIRDYGGILTPSGRGSAVSMYINKLLRFTKVDAINADVIMYPERFLTATRINESHTPPDVDHNVSSREPFIQAQKDIIGEQGTFDLLALGTLHYKSAFKMYARAYKLDPQIANDVTKQIAKYELALKHTEDDDKDLIDIYDYVDKEKYGNLIEGCQQYMGIVDTLKSHPCGCLCYDGDAIEDVGVIMVKSESTGRECEVALLESGTIDAFGFLKQDYLVVDSIGLTYDIYKEIGIKPLSVNQLLRKIENDDKTWNIYKNGYTICVNQCEQEKSTQKVMRYSPKNISELTQFVAGIRPSFQTMYKIFENREHFDYGIKAFDDLLQDEFCSSSFILYQETLMKVLGFAGFPMSETYTIIKAISKKKTYIIKGAKEKFIPNFAQAIIDTKETADIDKATEMAKKVWEIIENSASYGFNCISGKERIFRQANCSNYNPTIEEMYKIMHDSKYAKETNHKSLHNKYKRSGYGKTLSLKNNVLLENNIVDIYYQGEQDVYKVTTEANKTITCTLNHKFPTLNGLLPLSEIKVGDKLFVKGQYKHKYFDSNLTNGNFELNIPKKGQQGFQKRPNGVSVIFDAIRQDKINDNCVCEKCGTYYSKDKNFELHHKDGNRKNNDINNFEWLCNSCHKKEHYKLGRTKRYGNGIEIFTEKITSIEYVGKDDVYDIEMSSDISHTLTMSNGIVTSNSAHAYCMAIDSATLAWQKAYYPLEFYKVCLQRYTDKGNKNKVALLKQEMIARGYKLRDIKFGDDNRKFNIDKDNNSIVQMMSSIKNMQKVAPEILYKLGQNKYDNLFFIFKELLNSQLNKTSIDILIRLDYFSDYGDINYISNQLSIYKDVRDIFNKISTCKQLKKQDCEDYGIDLTQIKECCEIETTKMYKNIDNNKLLKLFKSNYKSIVDKVSKNYEYKSSTKLDKIVNQIQLLGYTNLIDESQDDNIFVVSNIETNKYGTPFANLYQVNNGTISQYKVNRKWYNEYELNNGDIIRATFKTKNKRTKVDDKWIKSDEIEDILESYFIIKGVE